MPILFKIGVVLFTYVAITGVIRRIHFPKYIHRLLMSNDDEKDKIVKLYKQILMIYRILFFVGLVYMIVAYLAHSFKGPYGNYVTWSILIVYILIFEDYLFRKKVLTKLGQK